MSIVIVASFTPKPGRRDALRTAFLAAVPKVHAEPGCERYTVQEDEEGFVFLERWESEDALATHEKGAAFVEMMAAVGDDLATPPGVRILSPRPAGDPAKGAL
jgi:quinol monooxygenase YgiN